MERVQFAFSGVRIFPLRGHTNFDPYTHPITKLNMAKQMPTNSCHLLGIHFSNQQTLPECLPHVCFRSASSDLFLKVWCLVYWMGEWDVFG